jgi:hypothetical protein
MEYLTIAEINAASLHRNDDYIMDQIKEVKKQVQEVEKFYPCYPLFACSHYDGKYHYEHSTINLKHPSLNITIKYDSYRKKWYLNCPTLSELKNVTHGTMSEAKRSLTEPNNIGVLTDKKILQWVNYYESIFDKVITVDLTNYDKKQTFLKSLEGLPVQWQEKDKKGWIKKNGIEYTFSIEATCISENIKIHTSGMNENLSTFLKLSDNKYIYKK